MSSTKEPWSLPRKWQWTNFAQAAEIAQDLVDPASVPDMPHVAPNNIGAGNRQLQAFRTVKEDGVISPKQRFNPGQILFTKIRPYMLKSVRVDFAGVCSADMYPLWARPSVVADYLLYWLTSPDFRDLIAHSQGRSVLPKINQPALNSTPFPLPPLPEQRRIVSKIDSLSTKSRRAREQLDLLPRLVDRYKQAVLEAAFGGLLSHHPVRFEPFGSFVSSTFYGPRFPREAYVSSGVPTIRTTDFSATGDITLNGTPRVEVSEEDLRKWGLVDGDILVTRTGSIGKCAVFDGQLGEALPSAYLIRVRLNQKKLLPKFAYWRLCSPEGQTHLGMRTTAVTQPNINADAIRSIPIPLVSIEDQTRTVLRIEAAFSWIDRVAAEATRARKLIDQLDRAVLAKAFRGELVPQHLADEPSSALLDTMRSAHSPAPRRAARRRSGSRV